MYNNIYYNKRKKSWQLFRKNKGYIGRIFAVPAYCVMIHDIILKKIFCKYMSEADLEQDLEWKEKGERL